MIRTNLSTRPSYNARAVRAVLAVAAAVVAALTIVNVGRIVQYSRSDTALAAAASNDEGRAASLRRRAAALRATIDTKQLDLASAQARQANDLIDRRTFSWTALFNQLETTLPDNARIASIRPKVDTKQGIILTLVVVAKSVQDVDQLMDRLEGTGAFRDLLPPEQHVNEEGLIEATIEAAYAPGDRGRDQGVRPRP
ncbi:MAG: PilN domain-containing protein [Acidobacteriota bacterium]